MQTTAASCHQQGVKAHCPQEPAMTLFSLRVLMLILSGLGHSPKIAFLYTGLPKLVQPIHQSFPSRSDPGTQIDSEWLCALIFTQQPPVPTVGLLTRNVHRTILWPYLPSPHSLSDLDDVPFRHRPLAILPSSMKRSSRRSSSRQKWTTILSWTSLLSSVMTSP